MGELQCMGELTLSGGRLAVFNHRRGVTLLGKTTLRETVRRNATTLQLPTTFFERHSNSDLRLSIDIFTKIVIYY